MSADYPGLVDLVRALDELRSGFGLDEVAASQPGDCGRLTIRLWRGGLGAIELDTGASVPISVPEVLEASE